MTIHDEEPEVIEEKAQLFSPKLTIVIILSTLLGILLTLVVGAVLYFQNSKALQAEVLVVKKALKEKSLALEDMKAQNELLSRQVNVLKEYSIARSNYAGEKVDKAESAAQAVLDKAAIASKLPGARETSAPPESPVTPKVKKPQAIAQNCELVGKSPDEQAATLRRCVNLIDPPSAKPHSR